MVPNIWQDRRQDKTECKQKTTQNKTSASVTMSGAQCVTTRLKRVLLADRSQGIRKSAVQRRPGSRVTSFMRQAEVKWCQCQNLDSVSRISRQHVRWGIFGTFGLPCTWTTLPISPCRSRVPKCLHLFWVCVLNWCVYLGSCLTVFCCEVLAFEVDVQPHGPCFCP